MMPLGDRPVTTWDHCLAWADLLTSWRETAAPMTEDLATTLTDPDRPLVLVLLAAALHDRATTLHLSGAAVEQVPLYPTDGGAAGVLLRHPYTALTAAPHDSRAAEERAALLAHGEAGAPPDRRITWDRIRAAASAVVAGHGAAGHPPDSPYWRQPLTVADRRPAIQAALGVPP